MKKSFVLFGVASLLSFGVIGALINHKEVNRVTALEEETSIEMNASFFTNWDENAGTFKNTEATCWNGKTLNALGSVFDGCLDHEAWTGTLHSRKWHQTTEWIYFQYGCANNSHVGEENDVKLVFKLWANENDEEPTYSHDFHNDTFSQTTMLLRNYHINDEEYSALHGDFYMSVDLVDGRGDDYGANEFGYLHVNQTHQQVSDAQWLYYKSCVEGEAASATDLRNHYRLNGSLKNGFVFENGFMESFDTQESFNDNWVKDEYGNDIGERHADRAISNSTYRQGSNMPFNSTNGFFKGWYGDADGDTDVEKYGYVASDDSIYRFVSRPFRLPENGIVTVMMAGNSASLHLLDFESTNDLAWVDCRTFHADGDEENIALSGKNVCTMVRHVINFSKYGGRLVQLGIADVASKEGGWNAVYFDELKANYDTNPSLKVDVVSQTVNEVTSYSAFNDYYVNAVESDNGVDYAFDDGPDTDTSLLKPAAEFIDSYMNLFRRNHETGRFCSVYTSDDAKALINAYNGLDEDVQKLICASSDYHRVNATSENWSTTVATLLNLGDSIAYVAISNGENVTVYTPSSSIRISAHNSISNTNIAIIISVIGIATLALLVTLFVIKRKKHKI